MSIFFTNKFKNLTPYTPGEQPKENNYIKLNTNESPFPPSPKSVEYATEAASKLNLYPDPECQSLTRKVAEMLNVDFDEVLITNGSDEILNFAFMAFCDEKHPVVFPDITYGFYPVFANLNQIPYSEIPLNDDFSININDYTNINKNIFIANPNAPTGLVLSLSDIELILKSNPENIVVIDEAYIDFGGESCVPLIHKYNNLIVTQTFSKSRSMAGGRLGFGVACKELISDLKTIKYSTNPYNINKMTMASGLGILEDEEYTKTNCKEIIRNREFTVKELLKSGFTITDSVANFIFIKHDKISGRKLYEELKNRKILVRHFDKNKISEYNRITIGTMEQMTALVNTINDIMEETK